MSASKLGVARHRPQHRVVVGDVGLALDVVVGRRARRVRRRPALAPDPALKRTALVASGRSWFSQKILLSWKMDLNAGL